MVAYNQKFEVEDFHSILNSILNQLADLPAEQKDKVACDLQQLQACVDDLLEEKARCSRTVEELMASNRNLTAQEEQYREIAESIQDGLIVIDQNWRIKFINSRAANNGGCEPEELIGRNLWESLPRLQGTDVENNYRRVMIEKIPAQFEMEGAYQSLWYSINVYPSTDGITVLWRDITARKQAEMASLERQKRLEQDEARGCNRQESVGVVPGPFGNGPGAHVPAGDGKPTTCSG